VSDTEAAQILSDFGMLLLVEDTNLACKKLGIGMLLVTI